MIFLGFYLGGILPMFWFTGTKEFENPVYKNKERLVWSILWIPLAIILIMMHIADWAEKEPTK